MSQSSAAPMEGEERKGRKTFIPLENNPQTLSQLSSLLGVPDSAVSFEDIFSFDADLLAFLPRPIHALIVTIPAPVFHRARDAEFHAQQPYTGTGQGEDGIYWFKQTIGHACGLIALLHALSNGEARAHVGSASLLDNILKETQGLSPSDRAQILYDSSELENAHMTVARMGDSVVPNSQEPNGNHFITFVKHAGGLWELNGGMKGPILRGKLGVDEDVISEKGIKMGIGSFLDAAQEGEMEFSAVGLTLA